jgi:hypothetical protein
MGKCTARKMLAYSSQNLLHLRTNRYVFIFKTHFQQLTNPGIAYSVVTDFVCALLPVVVLWNIKISLKTKIGVCGLMSLGLIATAVAIVRASSLGIKTADLSYDYCIAAIWANTELHLGIIATNLALSRMIWGFFFGAPSSSSSTTYTPRYGNQYTKNESGTRVSVDNISQASQIPLDPIVKRTSVHVSYAAASPMEGKGSDETLAFHHSEARYVNMKE